LQDAGADVLIFVDLNKRKKMMKSSEDNIIKLPNIDYPPIGTVNYVLNRIINKEDNDLLWLSKALADSIKNKKLLYFDENEKEWKIADQECLISTENIINPETGKLERINTANLLLITIGLSLDEGVCINLCEALETILPANKETTDTRKIIATVVEEKRKINSTTIASKLNEIRFGLEHKVLAVSTEMRLTVTGPEDPTPVNQRLPVDQDKLLPPLPSFLNIESSTPLKAKKEQKKEKEGCCTIL
jgi:hypothetical protein